MQSSLLNSTLEDKNLSEIPNFRHVLCFYFILCGIFICTCNLLLTFFCYLILSCLFVVSSQVAAETVGDYGGYPVDKSVEYV